MKRRFHNALVYQLVDKKDFLPYKDENGTILFNGAINIVTNYSSKGSYVVEIVDGDALTSEQVRDGLKRNAEMLLDMNAQVAQHFFKMFLFDGEPDREKAAALTEEEVHNVFGKVFLKCYSVNLQSRSMKKHVESMIGDKGLAEVVEDLLKAPDQDEIVHSDFVELFQRKEKENQLEVKANKPIATYVLIGINILVAVLLYLYSMKSGTSYTQLLYDVGAKVNDRILAGEYFRFLTPIFLHAGTTHLLINCYSLYAVGSSVETIYGTRKFLITYFVAGILGNVASFMFSSGWGVGASGAIFGLMGALVYFGIERPTLFRKLFGNNILITIIINLVYGFSTTGIDNYAHLGGLVGGFLAMGVISKPDMARWYMNKLIYVVVLVALMGGGLFYGFHSDKSKIVTMMTQLETLDKASSWTNAETLAKQILALKLSNQEKSTVLWTLVKADAMTGNYEDAVLHGGVLKVLDPPNGHYILGVVYLDMKKFDLAKEELTAAKAAGASYSDIDKYLQQLK